MNRNWWKNAVVYQIYPRSFADANGDGIGDLKGITSKLDYLAKLGVDVIWLSPVYQSPNADNGYDISNYQEIMDEFGTMEDFDEMLEKAHSFGIKIMMDIVVNHTSDEHKWFVESRKSKDNPYRDYYIWRDGKDNQPPNRWASCFSGSAWTYDEQTKQYYLHLFAEKQPDLNWDNPCVRDEVYRMMTWWCEKGVDGFRFDVISLISKDPKLPDMEEYGNGYTGNNCANGPHVHEYLKEMNERVLSKYPLITVGECPGVDEEQALKYSGFDSHELNMIFEFEHVSGSNKHQNRYGKWDSLPMDMPQLREVMAKWQYRLEKDGWNSLFMDNHDQPRMVSRFGDDSEAYRKLSAKMLATCLHMQKGTPYIYQGEEIGMTNAYFTRIEQYRDVETLNAYRELVEEGNLSHEKAMEYFANVGRDNARTPMQWDDSVNAGFTTGTPWIEVNRNYSSINVKESLEDPDSVFYYYKKLIELRHTYPVVVDGRFELIAEDDPDVFAYTRSLNEDKLVILCNFSSQEVSLCEELRRKTDGEVLIGNYPDFGRDKLRAYEAVVLMKSE